MTSRVPISAPGRESVGDGKGTNRYEDAQQREGDEGGSRSTSQPTRGD